MENQINNEVKYCPYCGTQNKKENKFCISCGGALTPIQEAQPQPQPDNIINPVPPYIAPYQEPPKQQEEPKIGIHTIAGIIGAIPFLMFPLFLAIAVMLAFFYIFIPSYRKGILTFVNGFGKLIVGFWTILLILFGACMFVAILA